MSVDTHRIAERLSQAAVLSTRRGNAVQARRLYAQAAEYEAVALATVDGEQKPRTHSILAVSLVALLYKAGALERAEQRAGLLLDDPHVTDWGRGQLLDLLAAIANERDHEDSDALL